MSDKIIDDKEVETFANLFGESSNRELFLLAQRISFAQALKLLIEPFDETARGSIVIIVMSAIITQKQQQKKLHCITLYIPESR